MLNDLAKASKALDGKKILLFFSSASLSSLLLLSFWLLHSAPCRLSLFFLFLLALLVKGASSTFVLALSLTSWTLWTFGPLHPWPSFILTLDPWTLELCALEPFNPRNFGTSESWTLRLLNFWTSSFWCENNACGSRPRKDVGSRRARLKTCHGMI